MPGEDRKDSVDERNERYVEETEARQKDPLRSTWRSRHVTRRRLLLLLPVILLVSAATGQILYNTYGPGTCNSLNPWQRTVTPPATKIGLVDTLAYSYPDTTFVQTMASAAHNASLGFDYYTPSSLSLDTFVHLPLDGYRMLIFRTHIGYTNSTATSFHVAITTSEPYDNYRYVTDQASDQLANINENGSFYFGLTPNFVTQRMCGTFPGTIVMAMGCYAMNATDISNSFLQKGANTFIGWKGVVRVDQTDIAFEQLIPQLLQGTSINQAVTNINNNLGPGPTIVHGQPILAYQDHQGTYSIG